ncbi:CinA family protein [Halodesulfurarchaeum formicicum]|uniref:Nicotinamide-nucleotide amidase n=1 Tax=Halodesulfurarchaeum formicicum TaxID=1873524 RepID=A0A1J1ACN8_9EURY|nr:CinA family protein [Halodesulfurarchaeum formicicum]APE95916.1 nicotinamide-nucleotide amidase [Halodesulfurarchaeum formicicum]
MSDQDEPIEARLGAALDARDQTLATVESCTGGLIGSLVTDVSGSSAYFDRGFVTYSNAAKLDLGVTRESLDEQGAVSEPVAREMAQAARDAAGTTWAVSSTGIAGPTGGTAEKPVGTVYVGVAYAGEWGTGTTGTRVSHHEYDGSRTAIKSQAAHDALRAVLEAVRDQYTATSSNRPS